MSDTPDNMEMPCLCECGEWFELTDGIPSRVDNIVVCEKCGEKERKIDELEDELLDAQNTLSDALFESERVPELRQDVERIEKLISELKNG